MSEEDPRARLESLEREIEHLRRENQRLQEVHRGDSSVSDGGAPSSARSLRPIAEALPHLVWIWGPDGVEYYNRRFVEYTGRTLETGRKVSWLEWVHPDDRDQAGRTFMLCQRTGEIFECEERVRGVDGEYRWFLSRAWPLLGTDGRPERWFGALTDIDQHKRNEAALANLYEAAERERRRAEEANHAKDLFLGMMSHELRTPLTAILGWATILRARVPSPETLAKAILVIERNARAQAQLIDDLLDVTKILAGSMRIEVQDVDPLAVVEEAVDVVRPSAAAKGVEIIRALDADVGPLCADPARLKQVVWNLVSNAVKFTPAGGQVFVSLVGEESHVEFAVEDTGKGIPTAFVPHLFEPFRQADVGTTRAHGGLGLGLAIVSHLVELHGGVIEVTSKGEGKGARFVVRLPREHASSTVPEGAPAVHGLGAAPGRSLEGHRILVIDDEPDVLEMLSSYLSSRGATVLVAASAAEGLGKIKESRPDVVVCDIGMPGQDGYGFIEELRSSSPAEGSATPVVALTAYARPEDRSRAILHGFDTHVAKPLDPSELASVIERLSTSKAAARSRAG